MFIVYLPFRSNWAEPPSWAACDASLPCDLRPNSCMNFATVVEKGRQLDAVSESETEKERDYNVASVEAFWFAQMFWHKLHKCKLQLVCSESALSLSLYLYRFLPLSLGAAALLCYGIYILTNPNCGDCCRCCFCLHAKHILGCNVRHIDRRIINTIINTMG